MQLTACKCAVLWWHGRPYVRVQFLELTDVFCAFIVGDRLPRDGVCLRSFIGRCGSCSVQSVRSRQIGIMRMRSEKSTRRRSFVNSRRLALERLFAQYGFWLQILSFPTRLSPKRPRHSFAHSSAQQSRRPFRKLMFIYYFFFIYSVLPSLESRLYTFSGSYYDCNNRIRQHCEIPFSVVQKKKKVAILLLPASSDETISR